MPACSYAAIANGALSGCRREDPLSFVESTRKDLFWKAFGGDKKQRPAYTSDGFPGKNQHCYFPETKSCGFGSGAKIAANCKASGVSAAAPKDTWCKFTKGTTPTCVSLKYWKDCESGKTQIRKACEVCNDGCRDFLTSELRAGTEALTFFVLCTVAFTIVAVVWNNFLTRGGNDEFNGTLSLLGYLINAAVLLIGFIMICLCGARMVQSEGYFGLLLGIMFLGVFLLIAGGAAVAGLKLGNPLIIQLASALLALFGYIMLIVGVALAVCTGTVMESANTGYDQNYKAAREQLEKIEPSYCQLTTEQCERLTVFGDATVPVVPLGVTKHSPYATWEAQYLSMQTHADWITRTYAGKALSVCANKPVCVACSWLFPGFTKAGDEKGKCGAGGTGKCSLADVGAGAGPNKPWDHFFDGVNLDRVAVEINRLKGRTNRAKVDLACTQRTDGAFHSLQDNSIKFGYPTGCTGTHTVNSNSVACRLGWVFSKDKKSKFAVCENAGTTNGGTMTKTNSKSAPFSPIGTPGQCKTPTTSFVTLSTAEECTKLKTNCPSTCNHTKPVTAITGSSASPYTVDSAGKSLMDEYMTKVAKAWLNRTYFSSNRQGKEVSLKTSTCQVALRNWADSASCKQYAEDITKTTDAKKKFTLEVLSGCSKCGTVILTLDAPSDGMDKAACLEAMIAVAKPSSSCKVIAQQDACHKMFKVASGCAAGSSCSGTKKCTTTAATAACTNFKEFHVKMPDTFCQYTDGACQTKIKEKTRSDLKWVGLWGGCFCGFFLVILYCMYRGMLVYMTDDDDDDDE